MRRRYIAALVVIIPVIIVSILKYYFPISYDFLIGYMVLIAITFKTAIISFYTLSKLKLITFFKSLTIIQAIFLLVKRWLLDNVFATWLKRNIVDNVIDSVKNTYRYYKSLNLKRKIKNFFIPLLVTIGSVWFIYNSGYLDNIFFFAELKVIIIWITKTILLILNKIVSFFIDSWITPIVEVFAFSIFLTKLEDWLGKDNFIVRGINKIADALNSFFSLFSDFNQKYIDPYINSKVYKKSKEINKYLNRYINRKKTEYEYEQFERLETKIMKGHIDAYFSFKGMEKIKDKKELYSLINKKTKDYLDIIAFVSRNEKGELVPEDVEDSYYHDIFILEGVASSHKNGASRTKADTPDYTDFWILNSSNFPVKLLGTKKYDERIIEPKSVTFIKTKKPIDYSKDKICFEFKEQKECAIVLD